MPTVSCIIPAYNEGPRIGAVLEVARSHPSINEIIVVDDASVDETREVVAKFSGITALIHSENQGKSGTVADGLVQSKGDVILLLDADLIGLTSQDISELIEPVLCRTADISISIRRNSPWLDRKIGLDFISGERVFPKTLVQDHIEEIRSLPRFGLESYLNRLIIKNRLKIKVAYWENVISLGKYKKRGLRRGLKGDFNMILDILATIPIYEVVYQFVAMSILKID